ncbi:inositol monophosphatase family protein [Paenibacillus thalictri]|uniref:Inositol monophosphatase n=1 Tax=Paenibacillus thalictri TaxID=2527873 RepID=A0A4Q9DIQ9_9BACL|nr:inositol monophosphatase [Paenibacillus thalictri]TBL71196.1 inositol monophosphatase [Paenibacillus thalictri]
MNREQLLRQALEAAVEAAKLAGETATNRFGSTLDIQHKGSMGDLVTEIDLLTDKLIVDLLQQRFPEHRIHSEEAGENGTQSEWVWHVDPLDGTNNFALGIPLYGVSISLSHRGLPVVGVVHDSALQTTYTALAGQGAWRNDKPITVAAAPFGLSKGTISWIQGHGVGKQDHAALQLRHHLEANIKRVLRVWAPSLTWAMLARGDLQGIVLYNSEGDDMYAGVLIAQEAGATVTDFEGRPLAELHGEPYIVAAHPDNHAALLQLVNEALPQGKQKI